MNEDHLYSDKTLDSNDTEKSSEQAYMSSEARMPDGRDEEDTARHFIMPDSSPAGMPSGYSSMSDNSRNGMSSGSSDGNTQIPQEPKPEVSWNEPQPELYREGTFQSRGEYHQIPPQGMSQQIPYQQMQQEPYQAESQGFGIASMVMGIISLVLCCSCVNIPLAVVAIVFGILQLIKPNSRNGAAITGIVTSVLSIVIFFISLIAMLTSTDFKREFQNGFENGLEDYYYNYDNDYHNDHHDNTF